MELQAQQVLCEAECQEITPLALQKQQVDKALYQVLIDINEINTFIKSIVSCIKIHEKPEKIINNNHSEYSPFNNSPCLNQM